jgi:hypothetical protein
MEDGGCDELKACILATAQMYQQHPARFEIFVLKLTKDVNTDLLTDWEREHWQRYGIIVYPETEEGFRIYNQLRQRRRTTLYATKAA